MSQIWDRRFLPVVVVFKFRSSIDDFEKLINEKKWLNKMLHYLCENPAIKSDFFSRF